MFEGMTPEEHRQQDMWDYLAVAFVIGFLCAVMIMLLLK